MSVLISDQKKNCKTPQRPSVPGDLQFLNSFRALRHLFSEIMPSHDNFSSSFNEITFSVSKKVELDCVWVSDFPDW